MTSQLRRRGAVFGICAVAALGTAACGSSSNSGSGSGSTTSGGGASTSGGSTATTSSSSGGSSSSALGSPKPAKGSPVVFGMINIESNPQASFPEIREAAQAAVKYVNAYGGGLDGHPIKL